MRTILKKIFGDPSEKELKKIKPIVDKVLSLEEGMKNLSDKQLQAKTAEFKSRLVGGETLDDILPEAFAVVCEASWRIFTKRPFPSQVIGGIILHKGRIAEMKTGEGKTLTAALPAYLNALEGKGVHIITVNDYLASFQGEMMSRLYKFLGMRVGIITHDKSPAERKFEYLADVTYATNNELGFDYLRDNMAIYKENTVLRGESYAIVDEVDSILIDEARTPLIISGIGSESTQLYSIVNTFAKGLRKHVVVESDDKSHEAEEIDADYVVDEKANASSLTPTGVKKTEQAFQIENLSDADNLLLLHHINQAIRAHGCMNRDVDYVVKDGEVIIVDEHTGRLMLGRRYSDGLHQAIEAKENVKVANESKTLATITFQNFFRLYGKLSGMTGTAMTEEMEFREIYNLEVIEIPTNKPMIRLDNNDIVYQSVAAKDKAVVEEIIESNKKGQPVLVGTISIEKSEEISKLLRKKGIKHEVLNAKYHEKEAEIVAQAGKYGAVTIATNMAGRGTDIILGGNSELLAKGEMKKLGFSEELISDAESFAETDNEEILDARKTYKQLEKKFDDNLKQEREKVLEVGGLYILGTERHESRRIDNQLRGRSGRQGDPGISKFYLSLEDDLMRIFGSDKIAGMVSAMGLGEDEPIDAKILSNAIESAQKKVEARNFEMRKNVLQFDEVMNEQRKVIYAQRQSVLDGSDINTAIHSMIEGVIDSDVANFTGPEDYTDNWDLEGLNEHLTENFGTMPNSIVLDEDETQNLTKVGLKEKIQEKVHKLYALKEEQFGENISELQRVVLLQVVDRKWIEHLDDMEQLKQGIGLRAYAQRDPVVEFKRESSDMFAQMIDNVREETVKYIFHARPAEKTLERKQVAKVTGEGSSGNGTVVKKPVVKAAKVGRNDPCPCGSGKKYKKCCGINE